MNCLLTCDFYVVQVRFIDKVLIACWHMIFCFVQWDNNSLLQPFHHNLLYVKILFNWHLSALTLVWHIQQQQQQQQQSCKCYISLFLRSDSTQSSYSVSMCSHCCSNWCKFCSFNQCVTAAHLCSLFSDHCHFCSFWSQCSFCTETDFEATGSVSSIIVHKCNSYSEKWCVDFWQLYKLSETWYDAFFEMLSYVKAFQEMLQQL